MRISDALCEEVEEALAKSPLGARVDFEVMVTRPTLRPTPPQASWNWPRRPRRSPAPTPHGPSPLPGLPPRPPLAHGPEAHPTRSTVTPSSPNIGIFDETTEQKAMDLRDEDLAAE